MPPIISIQSAAQIYSHIRCRLLLGAASRRLHALTSYLLVFLSLSSCFFFLRQGGGQGSETGQQARRRGAQARVRAASGLQGKRKIDKNATLREYKKMLIFSRRCLYAQARGEVLFYCHQSDRFVRVARLCSFFRPTILLPFRGQAFGCFQDRPRGVGCCVSG